MSREACDLKIKNILALLCARIGIVLSEPHRWVGVHLEAQNSTLKINSNQASTGQENAIGSWH